MHTSWCQPLHFILLLKLFLSTCRPQPTDNIHLFVRLWVLFLPPSFSTLSTPVQLTTAHLLLSCLLSIISTCHFTSLLQLFLSTFPPQPTDNISHPTHSFIFPTLDLLWVLFFLLLSQVFSPRWYYPTAFCSLTLNPFLGLYCTACCFLSYANFPASYSFGLPQFCLGTCPSTRPPPPPSSPSPTQVLQYSSPSPPPSSPSVANCSVDDKQPLYLLQIK